MTCLRWIRDASSPPNWWTQWLGVTTDDDDFIVCDGAGDGGIDIAYLKRADIDTENQDDNSEEGDTWYLVQSKYGTAFVGSDTILAEGNKVIETLLGQNRRLSHDTRLLLEKLDVFRQQASDADRIVLVFATTDPISQQDREALNNIKIIARERITPNFDVEELSLRTIWEALGDVDQNRMSVSSQRAVRRAIFRFVSGHGFATRPVRVYAGVSKADWRFEPVVPKECAPVLGRTPGKLTGA